MSVKYIHSHVGMCIKVAWILKMDMWLSPAVFFLPQWHLLSSHVTQYTMCAPYRIAGTMNVVLAS